MRILIISYDLKSDSSKYEKLYESIKQAEGWWHYLDSFWIIETKKSVTDWTDILKSKIEPDDNFIVIEVVEGNTNGWLPQKAWDWIKNNTTIQ